MNSTDQHGNPVSGSADAVALYDLTLDRLLRYDLSVLELAERLAAEAGDAPMAQVMLGYLSLSSTDVTDVAAARASVDTLGGMMLNEREAMHAAAIGAWSSGDWVGASTRLDDLLERWPADLLALMFGHLLDFFLGDNLNLRDRVCRSLPAFDPQDPHRGFVHGMEAFGLEEAGSYAQAEDAGLAALAANPDDVWALHAVVHVMEMQGRVDDGIRFMTARSSDWGSGNLFTVHNWWHLGLYCLEAGRPDLALQIYDREIHHDASAGVPMEMLDASAMLWRLLLDGVDTGNRFGALADAWSARVALDPWYVFNDLHAVMALVGAGRMTEARVVVERLQRSVDGGGAGWTNVMMTTEIGLPAARAVIAHGEGRYDDVIVELAPIRRSLYRFGGSHAQRDALQRTLLDACIRAGRHDQARVLLNERLTLRPGSVYGWTQQARLLDARGDASSASVSSATAAEHRARFDAAIPAAV